jgi:ABC-2 type transport system permease protein
MPPRPFRLWRYVRQSALLVGRSLRTTARVPVRLSGVSLQPVVDTTLFACVFGSAIPS